MERREFIQKAGALTVATQMPWLLPRGYGASLLDADADLERILVNDVHSALNATWVKEIHTVTSNEQIQNSVRTAVKENISVSIAGGRHALGSQQFATDSILLDTTSLNNIIGLDINNGLVKVEAGIQWPQLIHGILAMQDGEKEAWTIRQKQGGSDQLCIGGALSANAHGRGLMMKPIVDDVEMFDIINPAGELLTCSRTQNSELFKLAIGGYGLFGIITNVVLRLTRRKKLRRIVELMDIEQVIPAIEERARSGCLYGDFQYDVDESSDTFMRKGILSCYEPVDPSTPIPDVQRKLSQEQWFDFVHMAYIDRRKAFDAFCNHHLSTNGQIYWSDLSQLSTYDKGYREFIDKKSIREAPSSLMLSELYVSRDLLPEFMERTSKVLKRRKSTLVYGTIRMIQRDDVTFLPWAKKDYACVIFNIVVDHTTQGKAKAADTFRELIDVSADLDGSYFLTYHKWARKDQVLSCYPQMPEFLKKKQQYDPNLVFQSNWYRHYHAMFKT